MSIVGWAVHCYTASGAIFGFAAILAVSRGDIQAAFLYMLIAVVIDATDGALARKFDVATLIPEIDGRTLDDVVDYFTYVIVPVLFMAHTVFPDMKFILALPIFASAFGFANRQAKTEDDFFLGFPSYWNIVAFYLWWLKWPELLNAIIIVTLSILVFIPWCYIYPSKTLPFRKITLTLGALWGLQLLAVLLWGDRLPEWWAWSSFYFPVYYFALSCYLHKRRQKALGHPRENSYENRGEQKL